MISTSAQLDAGDFHRRLHPLSLLPPLPEISINFQTLNQSKKIKSIPTYLTHIIHEEAFSPAFAHRHREAATKSL